MCRTDLFQKKSHRKENKYSPIQFNKQLIQGHSGIWLMIVDNSCPTNRIQLINEHYAGGMLFCSS